MTRAERKKIIARLEKKYKASLAKLAKIPGVEGLEIGFKEKDGKITDEIVFRVMVKKKKKEASLKPSEIIPKEINGIPTDVVEEPEDIPLLGRTNLPDTEKYDTIHGGIQVGNGTGGVGTIGCVATITGDNSRRVILSNEHVLYTGGVVDGQKEGHPEYYKSCCCDCDKIGKNLTRNLTFDCAIAELDDDVDVVNTIEEIGDIKGIAAPAAGDPVLKRGRTTGLTAGTILSVNAGTGRVTVNVAAGDGRQIGYFDSSNNEVLLGAARASNFAGLTQRYGQGTEKFAYAGDSGSVIVLNDDTDPDHHKVVALLNSIDGATNTQGLGFDINSVVTAMNITIHATHDLPANGALTTSTAIRVDSFKDKVRALEQELNRTEVGSGFVRFYYDHREEISTIINTNRKAKVLWHRHQGPKFVATVQRAIKVDHYRIPHQIDNISRLQFIDAFREIIMEFGSQQLILDCLNLYPVAKKIVDQCSTKTQVLNSIQLHRTTVS